MPLKLTRRSGSETWYVRGTVRGQSVYRTTGSCEKEEAEAIRINIESDLLKESIHGKKAVVTFGQAATSYVKSGGSPRFLVKLKADGSDKGLVSHFSKRKLTDLGQSDLDAAANLLYPRANHETRNRQVYTPFIAVWNHAVSNNWAEPRQWKRPRKPKGTAVKLVTPRVGTKPVSYERAAQFVSAMVPGAAQIMTFLFYTGMRPIEAFSITSAMVDLEQRWITLPTSKTGEPRGVPVHEFLVPLLESLCARGGHVFKTLKGKPYALKEDGGGQIKSAISSARARLTKSNAPIDDVSAYTARHSVSTQLVINGVHPHIKDQILGHAVGDMSRRYTSVPQKALLEAINTLPVPDLWRELPWWEDPAAHSRKLMKWGKPKM